MTALLHRLLPDHSRGLRVQQPARTGRSRTALSRSDASLAAAAERLATGFELDSLRSLHPGRITTGG